MCLVSIRISLTWVRRSTAGSLITPAILPGIFGGGFEDVTAISHEVAETFNVLLSTTLLRGGSSPASRGVCQGNLETGDPVEVLARATSPVPLKHAGVTTTYHPQTEALLQWFAQTVPSDALHGAYSYPDLRVFTAPAIPATKDKTCTAPDMSGAFFCGGKAPQRTQRQ